MRHLSGRYGIILQDRYGCLNHHRRGTCDNNRTIRRPVIEQRALSGAHREAGLGDAVAEAVRAYHDELNRHNRERRAQTSADRPALAKVERAIASIIAAIEDGMYQPTMKMRMTELEQQKAEIAARLAIDEPYCWTSIPVLPRYTAARSSTCPSRWPILKPTGRQLQPYDR